MELFIRKRLGNLVTNMIGKYKYVEEVVHGLLAVILDYRNIIPRRLWIKSVCC